MLENIPPKEYIIEIEVPEDELEQWEIAAQKAGLSVEDYVKEKALSASVPSILKAQSPITKKIKALLKSEQN